MEATASGEISQSCAMLNGQLRKEEAVPAVVAKMARLLERLGVKP